MARGAGPTADHDGTVRWQDELLLAVRRRASVDVRVDAVWLYGSCRPPATSVDDWSDLDVGLVVGAGTGPVVASPDWAGQLQPVWAWECSGSRGRWTLRAVFRSGRRLDLAVAELDADLLPTPRELMWRREAAGVGTTPARSESLTVCTGPTATFRFVAALAVVKVARGDLLVGTHLAYGLLRQLLEHTMVLRDRTTGSTLHRRGTELDALALHIHSCAATAPSALGVLEVVQRAAVLFDDVAVRSDERYEPDWSPLDRLVTLARSTLSLQDR